MKIAVVGAGISGNVAAYHLSQSHDVTLFEANDYVGGHTHTHDVKWQNRHYAIDTGFIVFNDKTYPHFIALLQALKVDYQPTQMSFSVKDPTNDLEYNGHTINSLFAQRRNLFRPSFYRLLRDILRFNRHAPTLLTDEKNALSLDEYLVKEAYGKEFIDSYILPMGAAIWSSNMADIRAFPARFFVQFFHNHGLLKVANRPQWYVIKGGSSSYLKPLLARLQGNIRLNSPVTDIKRLPNGVQLRAAAGKPELYDAVFMAQHSDQALAALSDASAAEHEILGAIRYQKNHAVLHVDSQILPKRKLAWAAWNYHADGQDRQRVALTYNMNILQGIKAPVEFCVTLNHTDQINPDSIIDTLSYDHPVFTPAAVSAQQRLAEISGVNRTYYCGAYWGNGFHEDGVVSALNAVAEFSKQAHAQPSLRRAS